MTIEEAHDELQLLGRELLRQRQADRRGVGQQPFGGSRASGTNDKAGRCGTCDPLVTPRTVKETLVPPIDYRYPFLAPDET